jgi:hypothetical protein
MAALEVTVQIGGIPICLRTDDPVFAHMLQERYAGYLGTVHPQAEFEIHLCPLPLSDNEEVHVSYSGGKWDLRRKDFVARWEPRTGRGWIRQGNTPYSADTVLRIVHSLLLAQDGGFLLHAASAVRRGRAFLLSGVSGAGKTTISRLAPGNVTLLTDEISFVRRQGSSYRAYGTPFAGELNRPGENCSAPIAALFFLAQGPENRIDPIAPQEAAKNLLRNTLFFAQDAALVRRVFQTALDFVERIPARRLTFVPDQRVWDLIG